MSRIIWSEALTPGKDVPVQKYVPEVYDGKIQVKKTRALPILEKQVPLPDKRVYRSLSRAGFFLSMTCLKAKDNIQGYLQQDPFSIGIYCAIENGPVDFASIKTMLGITTETFADTYKKTLNPKMYFRQLPNLASAQMGIFLGLLGPMNVYTNSLYGSLHALEQAEMDLIDDRVKCALVCSAFSFENPLMMERIKKQVLGDRVLCEGAGALLLISDGNETDWNDQDYNATGEYFSISHQIIMQIMKRRSQNGD